MKQRKESKVFFFEKKTQKTFVNLAARLERDDFGWNRSSGVIPL
jgi:hypothetical protein